MNIMRIFIGFLAAFVQSIAVTKVTLAQIDETKANKTFLFFVAIYVFCLISFFVLPNELRFISFILVITFSLYYILDIKNKIVLIYSFNTELCFTISEIFVSLFLVILGIESEYIVNNDYYNLLANILISLFSVLIIKLSVLKKILNKLIELFKKQPKLYRYLYLLLFVLYLVLAKNGMEFLLKQNYYINILFIIGVVIILTMIIKSEFKTQKINDENKMMLNYVTKYEKIITDQGKANHEFKNQLMVIRGCAQLKSDKVIEYIDSIVSDSKKLQSSYLISQLNNFPEGGIKGLLYYKISIMEDEKIKYELDVETGVKKKLNNLSIEMYKNITKILGVLLDNAIDASKKSKDKKINISVSKDKSYVIFGISNTYNGKIDLTKIGTGYSSKGNNHGYGLRLVKDIIEDKNTIFNIETSCEEKFYFTKLTIKLGNKKRKSK